MQPETKQQTEPFFSEDNLTALEAIEKAQLIAFAPYVFQATKTLRDTGILKMVAEARRTGLTQEVIVQQSGLSEYGVRVLLEAGLGIGLFIIRDGKYFITKTAYFILNDEMTRVNMDFSQDICYKGAYELEGSIRNGKPEGLQYLGPWETIYEGLTILDEPAKSSWYNFDHFYSDKAFPDALPVVFENKPKRILDIGGNTGKWTLHCLQYNADVEMAIMDLPGQLGIARQQFEEKGLSHRVTLIENNVLDESKPFPKGFDVIWMSQFLDCFSEAEITSILKRCYEALDENGRVFINETFWDRQRFKASAFSLQMTSLYFTTQANGNSQMYHTATFLKCIEAAGFEVVKQTDEIGISHTIMECRKK
jgi:ubiquinone/menaquinone biosynthesis C-methylase UbiE